MADWTVEYSAKPVAGVAGHGVLSVKNPDGQIVRSYEGLATTPMGEQKAIGTSVEDNIKAYKYGRPGPNYDPTAPSQVPSEMVIMSLALRAPHDSDKDSIRVPEAQNESRSGAYHHDKPADADRIEPVIEWNEIKHNSKRSKVSGDGADAHPENPSKERQQKQNENLQNDVLVD